MTKSSVLQALMFLGVAVLTICVLDILEHKPVHWIDGLIVGSACALGSLIGDYWRKKKAV